MDMPKIIFIIGTRPEGIKVAPVVLELRKYSHVVETVLVSTGQHQEMLVQALEPFGLTPDIDLELMQQGQTLPEITSRALMGLDSIIKEKEPQWVVGQGDTTTVLAAAIAAFYNRVSFAHIEAGLRTSSIDLPFPEEFNRRAVSLVTKIHFAPTQRAADRLIAEGYDPASVHLTGNTGVDAVLHCAKENTKAAINSGSENPLILVTTHRRENWGEPQERIATAVAQILDQVPSARAVVAMHRNPQVRETLTKILGAHPRVSLIEPPGYFEFVKLMQSSHLVLTDSGGVQEDAPALGIPVLVLREETERPEGVEAGAAKLVGTQTEAIVEGAVALLTDPRLHAQMVVKSSPYGDGHASERIRFQLLKSLGLTSPEPPPQC